MTPTICKFEYTYVYRKLKTKPLYALLYSYNPDFGYESYIFEKNGNPHGLHNSKWLRWKQEEIERCSVDLDELPKNLREAINRQIEICDEVNRRCFGKKVKE